MQFDKKGHYAGEGLSTVYKPRSARNWLCLLVPTCRAIEGNRFHSLPVVTRALDQITVVILGGRSLPYVFRLY